MVRSTEWRTDLVVYSKSRSLFWWHPDLEVSWLKRIPFRIWVVRHQAFYQIRTPHRTASHSLNVGNLDASLEQIVLSYPDRYSINVLFESRPPKKVSSMINVDDW